ncbi:MAG: C10 family peptidase [Bacteroidetes bacterium]|nr:C10 family peptidase [Bacteroidota bacterium]
METNYFLKKKSILLFCFSFLITIVFAGPVGKDKAQQVAQNFMKNKYKAASSTNMYTAYEAIMDNTNSQCVMHVFKGENSYIVIAADDRIYPVLAYSDESSFSAKGKVPAFDWWMENVANSIVAESRLKSTVKQDVASAWALYTSPVKSNNLKATTALGPLLTTFWSQEGGYNYYCPSFPTGPSGHCVTGCVATAMAQVMKYYNYPNQGVGTHSYTHPAFGLLSADFGNTYYHFNDMGPTTNANDLDTLNRNAIAKLIYHCGVGVEMDYNPTESGSYTPLIPYVLYDNFKYRRFVNFAYKTSYTDDVWRTMIIENLDMHQPLVYSGSGSVGGHAWVCDGYDSPNHFHFNWGWSGSSNGYFYLNNLNSGNGTFNANQGAVFNIVPDSNIYPLCGNKKYTAKTTYTFSDGSNTDPYWNNTNCQWLVKPDSMLATDTLKLSFIEFNTEAGNDILSVYDGTSTSGTLLGSYSGSTIPSTLISATGSFYLVFVTNASVTNLGWKVKYDVIHKIVVGLQENTAASDLSVYPNPAHGKLNISASFKNSGNVKYTISNIVGAEVFNAEMSVNEGFQTKSIDITQLKAGVYLLSIENENGKSFSKFVVE